MNIGVIIINGGSCTARAQNFFHKLKGRLVWQEPHSAIPWLHHCFKVCHIPYTPLYMGKLLSLNNDMVMYMCSHYLARDGLLSSSSSSFSNTKALSTDTSLSQQPLWELAVGGACGLVGGVCWGEELVGQPS